MKIVTLLGVIVLFLTSEIFAIRHQHTHLHKHNKSKYLNLVKIKTKTKVNPKLVMRFKKTKKGTIN